jgi:hypothetical protein
MKLKLSCLLALGLLVSSTVTNAQTGTPSKPPETPEQQAARLKEKTTKVLADTLHELQGNNDQESASFVSGLVGELDQPGGATSDAIAALGQRLKAQVRELVRKNALESAATLNWAQWQILRQPGPGPSGPAHPSHKSGGTPGPGGLVLYLPFDKPDENGVVRDESGAGNDGQVSGAQWVPGGKFGGAYQFHITNLTDRIVVPNSDTLNPDYITIAAWVKTADRDGFWNRIVDKHYANGYCLGLGGDFYGKARRGKLEFECSGGSVETARLLADNQWHHVAATFDGKEIRSYLDGSGPARATKSPVLKKNKWDLCIGNTVIEYTTQDFLAFDGVIDEVRIYNRALSPDEIKALATATHAGAEITAALATSRPDAGEQRSAAVEVTKSIQLLPATDLDAFYVFIKGRGVNRDAKGVFTLTNGMLRVSGEEEGYLATKAQYSQYRLVTEYKWGALPEGKTERDSGVFVHGHGPDKYFMEAVECSLYSGRDWVSGLLGSVPPNSHPDWENPIGQRNTLELLSDGASLLAQVNGHRITGITNAPAQAGKILLQSRWGEIFFRRLELQPLENRRSRRRRRSNPRLLKAFRPPPIPSTSRSRTGDS